MIHPDNASGRGDARTSPGLARRYELHAQGTVSPDEATVNGRTDEKTSVPGVYRRGNRYVVIYRDRRGKQYRRAARTLAEARIVKAELTAAVARGEYRDQSRDTYTGRSGHGVRPATLADYRRYLEREGAGGED